MGIGGYSRWSFVPASPVVKRQLMITWASLRSRSRACASRQRQSSSGRRCIMPPDDVEGAPCHPSNLYFPGYPWFAQCTHLELFAEDQLPDQPLYQLPGRQPHRRDSGELWIPCRHAALQPFPSRSARYRPRTRPCPAGCSYPKRLGPPTRSAGPTPTPRSLYCGSSWPKAW